MPGATNRATITSSTPYPVLKRQNEGAALGFVTSRVLEAGMIFTGVVSLLSLVTWRQHLGAAAGAHAASLVTTGASHVAIYNVTFLLGQSLIPGLNALLLDALGPPVGLDAVRARLKELEERDPEAGKGWAAPPSERVEAAQRHAAEAHAAAVLVLASSAEAFRHAAAAHERAARAHEKTAAAGIGDVIGHEQQASLHRAAAAADRQRAERAQSLLSESERTWPGAVVDKPGEGVAS